MLAVFNNSGDAKESNIKVLFFGRELGGGSLCFGCEKKGINLFRLPTTISCRASAVGRVWCCASASDSSGRHDRLAASLREPTCEVDGRWEIKAGLDLGQSALVCLRCAGERGNGTNNFLVPAGSLPYRSVAVPVRGSQAPISNSNGSRSYSAWKQRPTLSASRAGGHRTDGIIIPRRTLIPSLCVLPNEPT